MKKTYYFLIFSILIIFLNSCTPRISSNIRTWYPALEVDHDIIVIPYEQSKPKDAELLGTASIVVYEYMIECSYEDNIKMAKQKARDIGGDCIHITWHLPPSNAMNTCHQIKFEILKLNDHQRLNLKEKYSLKEDELIKNTENDTISQKLISKGIADPIQIDSSLTKMNTPASDNKSISSDLTLSSSEEKKVITKKIIDKNFKKIRIGVSGGFSYQSKVIEPNYNTDYESYYKDLATGNHINIDANYFFNKNFGIGLRYNSYTSTASLNNIYEEDMDGNTHIGLMKDNIKVTFWGPAFSLLTIYNDKNEFLTSITLGMFNYRNKGTFIDHYLVTANTLGISYDFAYYRRLTDNFSFNFQVSLLSANYKNYYIDIEPIARNSKYYRMQSSKINRLDTSLGLSYRW